MFQTNPWRWEESKIPVWGWLSVIPVSFPGFPGLGSALANTCSSGWGCLGLPIPQDIPSLHPSRGGNGIASGDITALAAPSKPSSTGNGTGMHWDALGRLRPG